MLINALNTNAQSADLPVQHAQSASKSVRRPANHVAISTYKVALPVSSKFTLTKLVSGLRLTTDGLAEMAIVCHDPTVMRYNVITLYT